MDRGADAVIDLNQPLETMHRQISGVLRGETILATDRFKEMIGRGPTMRAIQHNLTNLDVQILQLKASGMTHGKIAADVGYSIHTVANHLKNAARQLNTSSTTAAVAIAVHHGLIEPPALTR